MSFKEKYLKYKKKYLLLKNKIKQIGGNRELYMAVFNNDTARVHEIVHRMQLDDDSVGIDYNYVFPMDALNKIPHKTMINLAIENQNYIIIELLLNSGYIYINNKDENGNTYFMNAILTGNISIINLILRFNPDLEITNNNGDTALILATRMNNIQLMSYLQSYYESLMQIDEAPFVYEEPDVDMLYYNLPREIIDLINNFTRTIPLLISRGNRRLINDREANYLIESVKKDFKKSGAISTANVSAIVVNPLTKIFDDLSKPIERKPTLIIDGENALGEFNYSNGNFYTQGRYRYFEKNGIFYEVNILLLFINFCITNRFGKLIIVCKNENFFKKLVNEYIQGNIIIRRRRNNGAQLPDLIINTNNIKEKIGFDFTIDIIHVTATGSMNPSYPKDLKSYDDCLILGLIIKYSINNNQVYYYTKDKQMLYDFYIEKEILLPFLVTINNQNTFLFQPHLEPLFVQHHEITPHVVADLERLNIENDSDTLINNYMDALIRGWN